MEPNLQQPQNQNPIPQQAQPAPQPKKSKSWLVILLLVIAAVAACYGVYAWQQSKLKDSQAALAESKAQVAKLTAAQKTQTTPQTPVDTTSYLKITEWGVKVPLSADVAGLSYKMGHGYTSFTSTALSAANGSCTSFVPLVARGTANEVGPSGDGKTFAQIYDSLQQSQTQGAYVVRVKIGNYYYVDPGIGQAGCASSKTSAVTTAWNSIVTALNKMVTL